MRKVPKLRFKEFTDEWDEKKLGEISEIYDGIHQTPNYVEKGIKFVSVEDIKDIENTNKFITEEDFEKGFKIKPQKDDILMTRITAGVIGATYIVKNNYPLAYYVSLALIRKKEKIDVNFLSQNINSKYFKKELNKRIIHVAFPKKINLGDIGECTIKITKLQEQEKIDNFLTSVDKKISLTEEKLELFREYKKGVMQKIFSQELRFKDGNGNDYPEWEEKRLGEISEICTGKKDLEDKKEDGVYPFFVRSKNIEKIDTYSYDGEAILIPGDGKIGEVFHYINGKFDYHQRVYKISNFKNIIGKYVYYFLENNFKKHALTYTAKATVDSLRLPIIKEFIINLPTLEEQQKIADFLSSINSKIESIEKELKELKDFKKGLLQQMFV